MRLDGKQNRLLFTGLRRRFSPNLPKEAFSRSFAIPKINLERNASRLSAPGPCHEILYDRLSNKVAVICGWINMADASRDKRLKEACFTLREEKDLLSAQALRSILTESRDRAKTMTFPSPIDLDPVFLDCEKLLGYYFIYLGIDNINDFFDFVAWIRKSYPDVQQKHRASIALENTRIENFAIDHPLPNTPSAIRIMLSSVFYFISYTQAADKQEILVSAKKKDDGTYLHFNYAAKKELLRFMTKGLFSFATHALFQAAALLEEELQGALTLCQEKSMETAISLWIPKGSIVES